MSQVSNPAAAKGKKKNFKERQATFDAQTGLHTMYLLLAFSFLFSFVLFCFNAHCSSCTLKVSSVPYSACTLFTGY